MHKKILLLLLALSSIFTSHQNISSLDDEYKKLDLYNKYKKNRFKKAPFMSLKLKNVFCDYKNIKGGLWKKAEDLLRMIESLEKYIQSGRMHPYDILSFSSPSLRKRDNSWTGFTKNNVSLNKIPSKLFRNKEYFLVTFILWRKNLFNNYKLTFGESKYVAQKIFHEQYTKKFFKELKFKKSRLSSGNIVSKIPVAFFYSHNNTAFSSMFYLRFLSNINTRFFLFVEKNSNVLLKLSFKTLLKMYIALGLTPALDDPDTSNDNKSFKKKICNELIRVLTLKINEITKNNFPLTDISLLFKVLSFDYLEMKSTINKNFIQSVENFLCYYVKKKNFYINKYAIEEILKNNFEFKKKIENLIITLENNVEHFDKQKSFFIYKAPLFSDETINLYNVNNKIPTTYNHDANEYDRIVRTKPIIKQLKQLLNILNLDSSYILDKSDVLK